MFLRSGSSSGCFSSLGTTFADPHAHSVANMRTFTTVALGLFGAAVASASDVSSLTKDTFTDFVTENDLVLAECKSPTIALHALPLR